jgi:hypothetical protein
MSSSYLARVAEQTRPSPFHHCNGVGQIPGDLIVVGARIPTLSWRKIRADYLPERSSRRIATDVRCSRILSRHVYAGPYTPEGARLEPVQNALD